MKSRIDLANSLAFIREDDIALQLIREVREDDGMGGTKVVDEVKLSPQMMRFINATTEVFSLDERGQQVRVSGFLTAMYDADIQSGDEFNVGDKHYRIIGVGPARRGRILAEVIQYGAA